MSHCDKCFDDDSAICGEIDAENLDENDPLVEALLMDGCECACHDGARPPETVDNPKE